MTAVLSADLLSSTAELATAAAGLAAIFYGAITVHRTTRAARRDATEAHEVATEARTVATAAKVETTDLRSALGTIAADDQIRVLARLLEEEQAATQVWRSRYGLLWHRLAEQQPELVRDFEEP